MRYNTYEVKEEYAEYVAEVTDNQNRITEEAFLSALEENDITFENVVYQHLESLSEEERLDFKIDLVEAYVKIRMIQDGYEMNDETYH